MSGSSLPQLADSADIEFWATRIVARSAFAKLVRSLITQTNDQARVRMPAGEGSEIPGYDGIVDAPTGSSFVPEGHSIWELGTGDPAVKATSDYRKRTKRPLGHVQAETTFVFVTPRRWDGKDAWIERRLAKSPWKRIWVLDVQDVEAALNRAPAAHVTFSDELRKPVAGVRGIEEWWRRFAGASNPGLTPQLALAGREDQAAELLRLLEEDVRQTTITAPGADEVVAFVAASVMSADPDRRLDLLASTLVVDDFAALRWLETASRLLVLIPYNEVLHAEAALIRNHHVVLVAPSDAPADITLNEIDRERFAGLLKSAGVTGERAQTLARAAGRSLRAFQASAAPGAPLRPAWTSGLRSRTVRRAWLAGGWSELRSGDIEILGSLLGRSYEDACSELVPASRGEDPLFVVVGRTWGVASPDLSWAYVRPLLDNADLSVFEAAVQNVLGAVDPALELSPSERWAAGVYGKGRPHSSGLRRGLATTLAMLGGFGRDVRIGGGTLSGWTEHRVALLLRRANSDLTGDVWASLSDVLELLAEAGPDAFLEAVRIGSSGDDAVVGRLFTDQGEAFSSSPHTGLLWALEGLAWSTRHLGLATECLARLAELDPGGRLSNRPLASLIDIFRPMMPQTSASVDARLAVLQTCLERHPAVAWRILLKLLPDRRAVWTENHAPKFRDWKARANQITVDAYQAFVRAHMEMMWAALDEDIFRWSEFIPHVPHLAPEDRRESYRRLRLLNVDE